MKILLVHQYYRTPEEGGAIRSYYIARHLAKLGHNVHVITAYNEKKYTVKEEGNITLHYLPVYYTNHLTFWSRIHAFYRFVRKAIRLIHALQPADFSYIITTPLSTGIIALYAKIRLKIPYAFEVGDLWPDAPVALGILNNTLLKKTAYFLERTTYKNAELLIALSPDIKQAIEAKVPGKNVEVITNMADINFFDFSAKKDELVEKYGVKDRFVIAYAGTVGIANHLEYLLDVADHTQKQNQLHFIIAGSGANWQKMKAEAAARNIQNITFKDSISKQGVKEILNVADAVYISFKDVPVLASGSPNKLFDGLAAGKLIIINFGGWVKALLDQNQCGFSYPPEKPEIFSDKLLPYIQDENRLRQAQANAHKLALQFTPEKQLKKLTRLISRFFSDYK